LRIRGCHLSSIILQDKDGRPVSLSQRMPAIKVCV
jgi:hypothetical protein